MPDHHRNNLHSDEQLRRWIAAWREGDNAAGGRLFDALAPLVTGFLRNKVYDKQIIEDLVQETFMKLKSATSVVERGTRSYVFGVAFNTFRHHLRARYRLENRYQALSESIDAGTYVVGDHEIDPEYLLGLKREERLLMKALRRVSLDDQVVIELFHLQELTRAEVADILGVKGTTMPGRLKRARERLSAKILELESSPVVLKSTSKTVSTWLRELEEHIERMKE